MKDMKKVVMAAALLLTMATGAGAAAAQNHRHTPQQELVDSARHQNGVEAFSDTTSTDTAAVAADQWPADADDAATAVRTVTWTLDHLMDDVDADGLMGMLFVLGVLFILFVLAPVLIIIALFYFINKNRKQRLQMAQMAIQNGQPIPEQLLEGARPAADDEYQRGMRQCFVGVGLMIFLGCAAGSVGFGVGALVFCIGLGKVVASRTGRNGRHGDRADELDARYNQHDGRN